jgi:hypothetical protein
MVSQIDRGKALLGRQDADHPLGDAEQGRGATGVNGDSHHRA